MIQIDKYNNKYQRTIKRKLFDIKISTNIDSERITKNKSNNVQDRKSKKETIFKAESYDNFFNSLINN